MAIEILSDELVNDGHVMRVTVRIPAGDKASMVREGLLGLAQEARLAPGEGGEIRAALEDKFGADNVAAGLTSYVASMAAPAVVNQKNLHIMFTPQSTAERVDGLFDENALEMKIDLILRPEYELTDYSPVHVKRQSIEITDKMVSLQIAQEMERFASFEQAGGPLEVGDYAMFDMTTQVNGQEAASLSGKNSRIALVKGEMPDGFIDAVVGMMPGDERTFDFTAKLPGAPDGAAPDTFNVRAKLIEKRLRRVPELTDEFVRESMKGAGVGETVESFRAAVKERMEAQLAQQQKLQDENMVDAELAKRLDANIPDLYLENTHRDILQNMQANLAAQGMTIAQYAQQQGANEQQFSMMIAMQARESLRQGFALDAYFRHMGQEVTDADIEAALHEMTPGHEEQARANFDKNGAWFVVRETAARLKAHNDVVSKAIFE
ncbi:trigger factor [Denitrobacterium detoxificans]|jgi:trigger factor|uniref:trigger factor n=1 Tax=Denitrobacterium detoxificans TaxID=79604 RepID=UPI0026EC6E32|nr:trigger factor [Denitrobacterium detoxificans]MBE6466849.1 hypothetical protein [Denitrobacterium detoxificans]